MTYANAMHVPLRLIPDGELFPAVKVIGAHKLRHRNAVGLRDAAPVLRDCNARIDELLREEDWRRASRRPPAKSAA